MIRRQAFMPVAIALGLVMIQTGAYTAEASNSDAADMRLSAAKQIFDTDNLDKNVSACQNLDTFVNAKWVAANPIPDDDARWGSFNMLAEKSLDDQHTIVKKAAAATDKADARLDQGQDRPSVSVGHGYAGHRQGGLSADRAAIEADRGHRQSQAARRLSHPGVRCRSGAGVRTRCQPGLQECDPRHRLCLSGRARPADTEVLHRQGLRRSARGLRRIHRPSCSS